MKNGIWVNYERENCIGIIQNGKAWNNACTCISNDYNEANLELIRYLVNEKHEPGVYITLNRPYSIMEEILKEHEIDPRMIIFVDVITIPSGGTVSNSPHCLYLSDLMNLTDMAFIIDEAISAIPSEKKFLFIDAMSTLLLYNNSGNVAKFIHFLSGKIRRWKLDGVFLSLETETDKEFLSQLSMFCDKTIKLDSEKVNIPSIRGCPTIQNQKKKEMD